MNIAFYTQQEIIPYTGGIGRVTSILIDFFRHHYGWKVFSLFAETVPGNFTKTETDGALQGRLHDRYGIRKGIKANTLQAARFLKRNQVDIVIVQTSMDVPMRLRVAMKQIGYNAKIITCLHFAPGKDIFLNRLSDIKNVSAFSVGGMKIILKSALSVIYNPLITSLTKKCYRNAYRYSDWVCLLSESYKDEYCAFAGIQERHKLLAMANPLSFGTGISADEQNWKQPVALVVGRLSEFQKRISMILSIWSRFEKKHPESEWRLKIVGNGSSQADYKKQAKELGLKSCSFEGLQNPIPYYKESKLFLMTSAFEGFPMTLVEAEQFGCVPIVMDSFSSLSSIITDGKNGRIITNHDEGGFLSAMEELMANPEKLQQLATNALEDCQRFSQENICTQWKKIIEQIMQ